MKNMHSKTPAGRLMTECTSAIMTTTTPQVIAEEVGASEDRDVPFRRCARSASWRLMTMSSVTPRTSERTGRIVNMTRSEKNSKKMMLTRLRVFGRQTSGPTTL